MHELCVFVRNLGDAAVIIPHYSRQTIYSKEIPKLKDPNYELPSLETSSHYHRLIGNKLYIVAEHTCRNEIHLQISGISDGPRIRSSFCCLET